VSGVRAAKWELDPAGFDDVWALGRLPGGAAWFCSPESKAVQTAQLLTEREVGVVPDLREQERTEEPVEDFRGVVRRAVAAPDEPAVPGWETVRACRERVVPAVRRLLDAHAGQDVVLVGHGTAWTLVAAELTGRPPDMDRWESLAMPDVITVRT
jgi:broad specificity phosphatase PhoE